MKLNLFTSLSIIVLFIFVFGGCATLGQGTSQKNKLVGVWQLVSAKYNGYEAPLTGRQVKTITASRYTWIYQDKDKAMSLYARKTHEDSLLVPLTLNAGAGTYKLVDSTYTETVEFSQGLDYIGRQIELTVKVEGNQFFQMGNFPIFQNGKKVGNMPLEEVFVRIE
jgi:hypothetical protein